MSMTQHLAFTTKIAWLAGLLAVAAPVAGHAQISPFLARQGLLLDRADFDLADAAARKLLEPQPAPLGTTETWANNKSGNSGTLTMGQAYRRHGHDCRAVSWHDVFKVGDDRTVILKTCHMPAGWKVM